MIIKRASVDVVTGLPLDGISRCFTRAETSAYIPSNFLLDDESSPTATAPYNELCFNALQIFAYILLYPFAHIRKAILNTQSTLCYILIWHFCCKERSEKPP